MATMPVKYPEFAQRLNDALGAYGTKDLVKATDATFAACSRWRNGQSYPRRAAMYAIAEFLGVDVVILSGDPTIGTSARVPRALRSSGFAVDTIESVDAELYAVNFEITKLRLRFEYLTDLKKLLSIKDNNAVTSNAVTSNV